MSLDPYGDMTKAEICIMLEEEKTIGCHYVYTADRPLPESRWRQCTICKEVYQNLTNICARCCLKYYNYKTYPPTRMSLSPYEDFYWKDAKN